MLHFSAMRLFGSVFGLLGIAVVAAANCTSCRAGHIVAGPVIGSVTPTSARIWMELSTSDRLHVQAFDLNTGREVSAWGESVHGPPPFVGAAAIGGLEPDHDYRLRVFVNGRRRPLPGPPLIIRTYPVRGSDQNYTFAFGSCADTRRYPGRTIWHTIANLQPRAFIFAGNSVYLPRTLAKFPYTYIHALRFILDKYEQARRFKGIQPLMRICPIYATWDDRDFGIPGSGAKFVFAGESMIAFQRYWLNPGYGSGPQVAAFCHFTVGDAEFFLLDDRTFRVPAAKGKPGVMLGNVQINWLKKRLLRSHADFKFIVDGDPMLTDYPGHESWGNFPRERRRLLAWIFAHDVDGVIFLTGHRRFGELTLRRPGPGVFGQYPLYDLTSSSLADRPLTAAQAALYHNPGRVGPQVLVNNFGLIRVGGPAGLRHVTLELKNAAGDTLLTRTISQNQLQAAQ